MSETIKEAFLTNPQSLFHNPDEDVTAPKATLELGRLALTEDGKNVVFEYAGFKRGNFDVLETMLEHAKVDSRVMDGSEHSFLLISGNNIRNIKGILDSMRVEPETMDESLSGSMGPRTIRTIPGARPLEDLEKLKIKLEDMSIPVHIVYRNVPNESDPTSNFVEELALITRPGYENQLRKVLIQNAFSPLKFDRASLKPIQIQTSEGMLHAVRTVPNAYSFDELGALQKGLDGQNINSRITYIDSKGKVKSDDPTLPLVLIVNASDAYALKQLLTLSPGAKADRRGQLNADR